jgi:hypothetical protein
MTVVLQGEKEFNEAVKRLIKSVKPDKMEPVLFRAAQKVTTVMKKEAPQRAKQGNPKRKPPGVLRGAIRTKRLQRFFGRPAPAISAVDRKKAPHAHLVHEGTGERIGKQGYKPYRGKRFGRMPGDPFVERAWQKTRGSSLAYIEKSVKKLVEGAASRGTH